MGIRSKQTEKRPLRFTAGDGGSPPPAPGVSSIHTLFTFVQLREKQLIIPVSRITTLERSGSPAPNLRPCCLARELLEAEEGPEMVPSLESPGASPADTPISAP